MTLESSLLSTSYTGISSATSLMDSIPAEVYLAIFTEAVNLEERYSSHDILRRISHVCHLWREITLLSGTLWSIALENAAQTHPNWFNIMLIRTQTIPLSFNGQIDIWPDMGQINRNYINVCHILRHSLQRIVRLDLVYYLLGDKTPIYELLQCSADQLETLSIGCYAKWAHDLDGEPKLGPTPVLEELILRNVYFPVQWDPIPSLRKLTLNSAFLPPWPFITPQLREITLQNMTLQEHSLPLEALRKLTLENVVLPSYWNYPLIQNTLTELSIQLPSHFNDSLQIFPVLLEALAGLRNLQEFSLSGLPDMSHDYMGGVEIPSNHFISLPDCLSLLDIEFFCCHQTAFLNHMDLPAHTRLHISVTEHICAAQFPKPMEVFSQFVAPKIKSTPRFLAIAIHDMQSIQFEGREDQDIDDEQFTINIPPFMQQWQSLVLNLIPLHSVEILAINVPIKREGSWRALLKDMASLRIIYVSLGLTTTALLRVLASSIPNSHWSDLLPDNDWDKDILLPSLRELHSVGETSFDEEFVLDSGTGREMMQKIFRLVRKNRLE